MKQGTAMDSHVFLLGMEEDFTHIPWILLTYSIFVVFYYTFIINNLKYFFMYSSS